MEDFDKSVERYDKLMKEGKEYSIIIKKFLHDHPEIEPLIEAEEKYILYNLLKISYFLDDDMKVLLENPELSRQITFAMVASFVQGYYRRDEKAKFEKIIK